MEEQRRVLRQSATQQVGLCVFLARCRLLPGSQMTNEEVNMLAGVRLLTANYRAMQIRRLASQGAGLCCD